MTLDPKLSSGIVDLAHQKWNVEDFEQSDFTIEGDKSKLRQVAFKKMEPIQSSRAGGWFNGVLSGIKNLVGVDAKSIYSISRAFDQICLAELDKQNAVLEGEFSNRTREERLKFTELFLEELDTLQENLKNHDQIIAGFNKKFFTALVACSNHQEILNKINLQREKIRKMAHESALQNFETTLQSLQRNIDDGQLIDRHFIYQSYPNTMELLKGMDPETAEKCLQHYHALINRAFIEQLLEKIEANVMPLPQSIKVLLSTLGFDEEIEKLERSGNEILKESLEKLLRNPDQFLNLPSPQLVNEIENELFSIASKQMRLTDKQSDNLTNLLRVLYAFEMNAEMSHQKYVREFKQELLDGGKQMPPEEFAKLKLMLMSYDPPPQTDTYLKQMLPDIDKKLLDGDPEEIAAALKKLKILQQKVLKNQNMSVIQVMANYLQGFTPKGLKAWFDRNKEATSFQFNQGAWGNQYILGSGACCAINYRWIKNLLANPFARVRSQQDLEKRDPYMMRDESLAVVVQAARKKRDSDPLFRDALARTAAEKREAAKLFDEQVVSTPYVVERPDVGVSAKDRKMQAEYLVSGSIQIPNTILKRDGLKQKFIATTGDNIQSVSELFKIIKSKKEVLKDSSGIMDIGIYVKKMSASKGIQKSNLENSHAMGAQVDFTNQIFRFWDVNGGMFSYPSLEKLEEEFGEYMRVMYQNEYNCFDITQYIPENKNT